MAQGRSVFDDLETEYNTKSAPMVKPVTGSIATSIPAPAPVTATGSTSVFDNLEAEHKIKSAPPKPKVSPVDQYKADSDKFRAAHPILTAPLTAIDNLEEGIVEGVKSLPGIASGIYHAFADPITTDTERTASQFGLGNPAGMALTRLIGQPTVENAVAFWEKLKQDPLGLKKESRDALVKALPVVGPGLFPMYDKLDRGDYQGAIKEGGVMIGQGAPIELGIGALKGTVGGIKNAAVKSASKAADAAALAAEHPYAYTKSIEPMAEAFGVKSGEARFIDFADHADIAMDEIKRSGDELFTGGIKSNRAQIQAGKHAMDRIYNTEIGPKVGLVGPTELRPLADQLKSDIPAWFSKSERDVIEKMINDQVPDGPLDGATIEKLRQKFSSLDRVNQAASNYVGKALEKTPTGWTYKNLDLQLRDFLNDQVNRVQPGTDIRPALQRYGAVTDVIQQAGGIPVDKTIMEILTDRAYVTGNASNLTGRTIQAATAKWYANDNLIRRAYERYEGPTRKPMIGPVQKPFTTAGDQQDLIPFADETDVTGIPPAHGQGRLDGMFGNVARDAQGNLFNDPMLRGPIITDTGNMFKGRMPAQWETPNTPPNAMEGMIKYQPPVTAMTKFTGMRNVTPVKPDTGRIIEVRPHGRVPVNQMPQFSPSTRINERQIATTEPKLLGPGFQFTIKGNAPDLIMEGTIAHTPGKIDPPIGTVRGASDPRLPAHYMEKNWQRSGEVTTPRTIDGKQTAKEASGPGTLTTTDPKVVESTVKALDDEIKRTRQATKKAELSQLRDDLVRQLVEYNRQRGAK